MADAADAPTRLYRAVAEGRSAAEVRAAIQACAASATYAPPVTRRTARSGADVSDAARSLAALVNRVHGRGRGGETALQAAHRLRRGDLVGLLLENGADAANLYSHRRHDPLALCIAYGQAESLRALLLQGGHVANRRLEYRAYQCLDGRYDQYSRCSPVHLCIAPPAVSQGFPPSPPQLACLRVLVEEFGADVDARDCSDETPLHWLAGCQVEPRVRDEALDLLVRLGADVNARDVIGATPIFNYARTASHPLLLRLIAHGANVDARNRDGYTALMRVVSYGSSNGESAMELLRRSSIETRRATSRSGWSALDSLAFRMSYAPRPWHPPVTAELLRSGCPFQPRHAQELLPVAIPVMQEQELDLEIFRSGRLMWDWRGHEAMVHLALQMQETRFYEEAVAERQAEVRRLEAELRARQSGGGGG
jgi:ankyrin repeat protein